MIQRLSACACVLILVGCNASLSGELVADAGAHSLDASGHDAESGDASAIDSGSPDATACTPSCDGRSCGPNGCGGSCGTCTGSEACTAEGLCCACAGGSPTPVARSFVALADGVDFRAPARGGEQWHFSDEVELPEAGDAQPPLDVYHRSWFTWSRLEPTRDAYDFSRIAQELDEAIENGQKFSFGVMTLYPGDEGNPSPTDGGSGMSYPMYLHALMQNASDPMNHGATDWNHSDAGWWVPNYNSEYYLDRFDALNAALNEWLNTESHDGVAYRDAIGYIDIRGFGSWGEWHHAFFIDSASSPDGSAGSWPVGMRPTVAALERIVDSYTINYPNFQLVAMIAAFDAEWFANTWNPPEIAQYILDSHNDVGPIGWRRDQWGSEAPYVHDYLENNNRSAPGGPALKLAITERWKYAPVVGEPECSGVDLELLPDQVTLYHASSVGNGNYCTSVTTALANNFREASRRMGYRIVLTGGMAPGSAMSGQTVPVTLNWQNIGIAPTYEHWVVTFELQNRTTNEAVWSAPSSHELRLWLPSSSPSSVTDMLMLPADLAPGDYRLVVKAVDPSGYRAPLPFAIEGRREDGSYTVVDTFTVGECTGC